MAYPNSKKEQGVYKEKNERLRLYAVGAIVLIALAVVSVLLVPSSYSSVTSRCNSLLIQQDRYRCIESAAVSTRNSTMCAALVGAYQDSCYLNIATNTTNPALCGKISSANVSDECYIYMANQTDNPSMCSAVGGTLGSECEYHIATSTNNTADCSLVQGPQGQLDCNATVDFDNAIRYRNATLCSEIYTNNDTVTTEGILQNSSVSGYPGLSFNITQTLEYSVFYNQSVGARDLCYTSLAYESHNSTYCNEVQNQDLSLTCSNQAGKSTLSNNITSNSTFNLTALLNSCNGQTDVAGCRDSYMSIDALLTGNVTICKRLPLNYSSTCFYQLAEKYNSTSYCSYITNSTLNQYCVGNIEGLYPGGPPNASG